MAEPVDLDQLKMGVEYTARLAAMLETIPAQFRTPLLVGATAMAYRAHFGGDDEAALRLLVEHVTAIYAGEREFVSDPHTAFVRKRMEDRFLEKFQEERGKRDKG